MQRTARRFRYALAAALLSLVGAQLSPAYIRSVLRYSDGSVVAIQRADVRGIQYYVNSQVVAGMKAAGGNTVIAAGSDPLYAIRASLASWTLLPASKVHFLGLKVTDKAIDPNDNQNTIAIGTSAADISAVGGALAITVVNAVPFDSGTAPTGDVADADIILNPAFTFSTDGSTTSDLQAVMTHELGHSLGDSHDVLVGATMFQSISPAGRYLSKDESTFATALYPSSAGLLGKLNGKVVAADGSPVQSGLISFIDTSSGAALSAVSAQDGTYSLQVPPGSYVLVAEPMGSNSIVQPGNLYLTTGTKVTSNFQATVLGGAASPTKVAVTAGNTTSAPDLAVTGGVSPLQAPYIGTGGAGASADIGNVNQGRLILISSGKALDIGMIGGGIDGTVSIQAFAQGVTVRPGSVRVDTRVSFGGSLAGQPFVRVTLDVAALQAPALMSLFITKGQNTFVLSGFFVVVPPKPVVISKGVVNAASYKGGANGDGVVSPGGIYSIYDTANNSLGPTALAQPPGYDEDGKLATTLGGVTVTFDGVAAPLYLSYSGQLNLQVPFEVAGKTSTQMVVNFYGSQSDPVTVPVVAAQPAFFTFTPAGTDVITQNFPDYSLNQAANPIARGGVVLMYGTGIGKLSYALATGLPGIVPPTGFTGTYSCSFGGKTVPAGIAYWNYGFVGEALWAVTIPADAPTGAVNVTCSDSATGATTQDGVIYIK